MRAARRPTLATAHRRPGRCSPRSTRSRATRSASARRGRPAQSYSRDFRGPNWLDLRKASAAYADRDPAVLVVGGGQAGLSIAARLTPVAGRHADRRSRAAHRRQLAQALSRADPAQPGAGQSPALHAVPAELADLHSEGQARRLVRGLCGEPWSSTTGPAPSSRAARYDETRRPLVRHAAPRRRRDARRCARATS